MTRMNSRKLDDLDDGDAVCPHENKSRAGIVTNQPEGYDKNRAHAAITVCGDPSCRARGMAWVWKRTGEHGTYVSDSSRKAKA